MKMNDKLRELVDMIISEGVEGWREIHDLPVEFSHEELDFVIDWIYKKVSP